MLAKGAKESLLLRLLLPKTTVLSSLEKQIYCLFRSRYHSQLNIHFFFAGRRYLKLLYHLMGKAKTSVS